MKSNGFLASLMAGILLLFLLASPAIIHSKPDEGYAAGVPASQQLVNDFAAAESIIDMNILRAVMDNTSGSPASLNYTSISSPNYISGILAQSISADRIGVSNSNACSVSGVTIGNPAANTVSVTLTLECHSRATPRMAISRTLAFYKKVVADTGSTYHVEASGNGSAFVLQFQHT